jgi:hypothetical protein
MRRTSLAMILLLLAGCSSRESWERDLAYSNPSGAPSLYQQCVNNLQRQDFYIRETNPHERMGLEVRWKAMCMEGATGGRASAYNEQQYRNQMGMGLLLQQQYLNELRRNTY